MTEAERAAAQAIFAEQVKSYEARLREQERTFTAIIQELEAEKTGLNARVRELERQREYLARELSTYDDQADCDHTHLPCEHRSGWRCKAGLKGQMQCWISEAEKAAKEAGE